MGKLEELMQEVMKTLEQQGFLPDSVELKVKVGENWYSVKWKKPVIYAADEFNLELESKGKSNKKKPAQVKKKAKKKAK
mgnify:CR=1 FL=1